MSLTASPRARRPKRARIATRFTEIFEGEVTPWAYTFFRVAIASIVLVRTTDWLAPILSLDHHAWVQGLEYAPWSDPTATPALDSPLWPGFGALDPATTTVLVVARTALAALLLLGVRVRTTALALALVGYALMASDRYRYLHHLHLMWTSVAWLALAPSGNTRDTRLAPAWPLQLLRLQALTIYAAAGLAKLSPQWLSGRTLQRFAEAHLIDAWASRLFDAVGAAPVATVTAATELALVPLLVMRRTRLVGVVLGVALHVVFSSAMVVSTFGVCMVAYLLLFVPPIQNRSQVSRTSIRSIQV